MPVVPRPDIAKAPRRIAGSRSAILTLSMLIAVSTGFGLLSGCSRKSSPVAPQTESPTGALVGGYVRDTTGATVAGALVSLQPATGPVPNVVFDLLHRAAGKRAAASTDGAGGSRIAGGQERSVLTNASGAFGFSGVVPGDYLVTASAPNHLEDSKAITVPTEVGTAPTDTFRVDLRIQATGSFTGKVTLDGATDFGGTVVYVAGTSAVALTDGSGNYLLDRVPLGTRTMTASHANYLSGTRQGDLLAAGDVVTLPDLQLARDLNTPPQATIQVDGTCGSFATRLVADAFDPDGTVVLYEWDFEDDGTIDSSGSGLTSVEHMYPVGSHRAKLVVTDDDGARGIGVANFAVVAADTVYVSSTTGSPSGTGSRVAPYSTLGQALGSNSAPCPRVVLVALGFYPEAPAIPSSVILRGGFDPSTWQRVPGTSTEIWTGTLTVRCQNVQDTEISDIRFVGTDQTTPSASDIVMTVEGCGPTLRFVRCGFVAGSGQSGIPGINGDRAGLNGLNGPAASGQTGGVYDRLIPYYLRGADGPDGPSPGMFANPGTAGSGSTCAAGGAGGSAGTSKVCGTGNGTDGGGGSPGQPGADGLQGGGQTQSGELTTALTWIPYAGFAGAPGCTGGGGGSGGAGGSACDPGGGGGAGGAPGWGGSNGWGGKGGGASIAVILHDSAPIFSQCQFTSASGGTGGDGGNGRNGGTGGLGGLYGQVGTRGGSGGNGGRGGHGGGGQGGPGGPSWCIVLVGTSNPTLDQPVFAHGPGGTGGLGGHQGDSGPRANPGPDGPSGDIGP